MRLHVVIQWLLPLAGMGFLLSCQPPDHYLIYPHEVPQQGRTWTEEVERGPLRLHLEWAAPTGAGPFPAVLVHPDGGSTAAQMRGVIWDLAGYGYLAVAVDYRRLVRGKYRRTLFPWRDEADVTLALEILRAQPLADTNRLAALGFSQGGVFSLLIAARAADIKAVVAYYPVTDFAQWLAAPHASPLHRLAFRVIRWYFRRQSGARNAAEYDAMLRQASPLHQAEGIRAPVLLIHGARDGAAPVAESQRLAQRLQALGREVELLVMENGVHVFNFKQPELATRAWQATLRWLEQHLGPG